MKTKLMSKSTLFNVFCILLLLLGMVIQASAQCPTITNPNPLPICDASGFTFNDLNVYATNNGGGIVWYTNSTGGTSITGTQLILQGGTYYADDISGSCAIRPSITISFVVNPSNQGLDGIYCSNDSPLLQDYINEVLLPNVPPGGSVELYIDANLTNLVNALDPIPSTPTNYYVVFVDNGGVCKSQIEIGSTAIFASFNDPTPSNPQMFCSDTNPTVADLDPGTVESFLWYQNIDSFGNPVLPALTPLTPLVDGSTYYVQVGIGFCESNPVPVAVTIDTPVNSGTSGTLQYCNDSLPVSDFNLFDELGGLKDTNGIWTGPPGITISNGNAGTINISTLTTVGTYIFRYTVPGNGACSSVNSTVIITVFETLSSGTLALGGQSSFCESILPSTFNLFTLLDNEDLGGQWTQGATSLDPIVTSPISLSGLIPGVYNYTYTQNLLPNPCAEESTTVQVTILDDPNAGLAVNQVFCENDLVVNSPFNLFNALDGSQDNNLGTWTDGSNIPISNFIDITGLTVLGSPYSFAYTVDNGVCFDVEIITITVQQTPESGVINVPAEFCEGAWPTSFDLFDLLDGEDQTGSWYEGVDNTGAIVTNPIDLSGLTAGTHNFTFDVDLIGVCDDELVTVQIIINPLPNTGTPNNPAPFCENDLALNNTAFDLFTLLNAPVDLGGTWNDDDDTSGALTGNVLDLSSLAIGNYRFTYSITDTNNCTNSTTVTIVIDDAPESGTVNSPAEFCVIGITTAQTVDLFDLLDGEDQSGTWSDDNLSGTLLGNTVTIDGLAESTYNFTYNVNAIGVCDDADVTVSIIINDTAVPTTTSIIQDFCDTAMVSELSATGTTIQWYDDATGGTPLTGITALVDGETYYATQTDATTNCESSVRLEVTARIYQSPNSGSLNATSILACNNVNNIDLFIGLDGTQDTGGLWQDTDATGALTGNIFDATGIAAGIYQFTYLVTATSPCIEASTTIMVTIDSPLNTGTDNTLDICSNHGTIDLFSLLGTADTGGTWSPALSSGTGLFDPLIDTGGVYRYSLSNACGSPSSEVVVTVTQAPNAGIGNSVSICVIDGLTDLFPFLGTNAQSGGTWFPALSSGTGMFDPANDAAGVYTYTVTAVAPCDTDSIAQITVAVNDTPAIVILETNPSFCLAENPTVSDLINSIRPTGIVTWYDDAALTLPLNDSEALVDGEDYYATQTNSTGCESSISIQVNVTVNDVLTPTLDDVSIDYCIKDRPTINDLLMNIAEYDPLLDNVIWYDEETSGSIIARSTILSHATTYYAVLVDAITGCESSVRLAVIPDITACGKLIIPDGFSPNGDGTNDVYDIDYLDILHPNFEIEIYNRYGNIVYKGRADTPPFDGQSNQSRTLGKGDLPVGVYFYIFNFNDGENKAEQGRLYLSR